MFFFNIHTVDISTHSTNCAISVHCHTKILQRDLHLLQTGYDLKDNHISVEIRIFFASPINLKYTDDRRITFEVDVTQSSGSFPIPNAAILQTCLFAGFLHLRFDFFVMSVIKATITATPSEHE